MKKIVLIIIITFQISCSETNSKKNIPDGYKIIEMNVSNPNDNDYQYKIKFDYNSNGKMDQIEHLSNEFNFKEHFEYESDQLSKISTINSNTSLNVNKIFQYENSGKLKSVIIKRIVEGKNDTIKKMTETAKIEFLYKNNRIEILSQRIGKNSIVEKEIIELDKNGNFLNLVENDDSKAKKVYDKKNNPNDLIYDKSLIANKLYGIGNLLSVGDVYKYTYEYNDLGFPIKKQSYQSGILKSITTYIYNK